MREFATTEMNLPEAEAHLATHLGHRYVDTDWRPALTAVMDAEGDVATAVKALEPLAVAATCRTGIKIRIPAANPPAQLSDAETMLMTSVAALKQRNSTDKAIAASVCQEMVAADGDVIEVDSDSDDDEDSGPTITRESVLELCQQLESGCLVFGDAGSSLRLSRELRIF
ncbi:hypothetical protein PAXRUDRAFT_22226 [Paxillus rubicundulus Ve08.2h10]|uniref:Uncharacterized protein n=1 Tax=Paxillus rubicundulus Ve08.2h10 TaxID=930991 RepID=A0A0D0D5R9_9AGAM|nr:hypothetical protein PAXRUDRAFT_22226 [Paxillus rubicundulus Ve08.2h10]